MTEAEVVLTGGSVLTMDPDRRVEQAVAVEGDRIVATGGDADIRPLIRSFRAG